uniref:Wrch protein n=1 Tax=Phallusia mammillata TaxID=59560 RepID=A0A6F9DQ59_9ASCI|nr:Wrch protein [Phallusia mammillata]
MAPDAPRYGHHDFPVAEALTAEEKCQQPAPEKRLKCVLVGDGAVGKTSLVVSYSTNGYPTEYVPTAFDNYSVRVNVDNQAVRLQICDTAGQDEFDNMRPLCYPGTDVVLVCFSVIRPTSLGNVRDKWLPEIRKHLPKVPVILVGTKTDVRTSVDVLVDLARYSEQPVTEAEGHQFAAEVGASKYVECSSLTQKHLKDVFDSAILDAFEHREHLERKCKRSWRKKSMAKREQTQWRALEMRRKSVVWWKKAFCFA